MTEQLDPSESVAVLVADGREVDWDAAVQSAPGDRERRVVRHLRLVESIARAHRGDSLNLATTGGTPRAPAPTPTSGRWAHLELRAKLGEGAFGEVYRAWDRRLEREVALKLLKPGGANGARLASVAVEEGRVLAKLRHPNVVTVYGAEVHEGRVGLWMEFVRGRSLAQIVHDQGALGAREAALIGIDLCRALAAVHRAGVVHRDVKAQNVMREEGGRIVLMDFGAGIEPAADPSGRARTISGTPCYMPPEVLHGEPASQGSDLYALGVLLYHLVSGSFPVEAGSLEDLRARHQRGEGKLLRDLRPDLPEPFVRVVERALAADLGERFATAGQMEQALSASLGVESGAAVREEQARIRSEVAARRRLPLATLVAAGLIVTAAVAAGVMIARSLTTGPASVPKSAAVLGSASPATSSYTVEAALYRTPAGSAKRERLADGARLSLGDNLTLELEASTALHVYVINEDDAGHAYALFPLPRVEPQNPLRAGTPHVLPGTRDGERQSWVVDSAGGREHLIVVASPTRLVEFEAEMNALARPGENAIAVPGAAEILLRGIGGLAKTSSPQARGGSAARLFDMAERLASRAEVAQGVWMRRIELANPPE